MNKIVTTRGMIKETLREGIRPLAFGDYFSVEKDKKLAIDELIQLHAVSIILLISAVCALRLPMTYDNHPIQPAQFHLGVSNVHFS